MGLRQWIKGNVRFLNNVPPKDSDARDIPCEMYAYSVVMFFKEGGWSNTSGLTFAPDREQAHRNAYAASRLIFVDKGDVVESSVHTHKMDADVLEAVKHFYNLKDGLDLWRTQLEDTSELDQ